MTNIQAQVRPNRKAISKQHKKATSQRFHSDVAAAYGTYDYLYAPTYASGRVLVNAMFSTILFQVSAHRNSNDGV